MVFLPYTTDCAALVERKSSAGYESGKSSGSGEQMK
jgi:hypothetical protein